MPPWVNVVVALLVFALVLVSVKAAFEFRSYCGAVAKHQGQTAEFDAVYGTDENSLNAYEREQYRRLMKGEFEDIVDKQLLVLGRRLAAHLKLLRALTIMLVLLIGIFYIGGQVR